MLPTCSGPPFFAKEFNIWGANSFVIVDDKPPPSNLPVPSHDFLFLSWSSIQFIRFQIEQIMQNAFLVSGNTGVFQISGTMGVTHFNSGPWLFIWSRGLKSNFLTLIIGLWSSQFLNMQDFCGRFAICRQSKTKIVCAAWPMAIGQARQNACKSNKVEQVDLNF